MNRSIEQLAYIYIALFSMLSVWVSKCKSHSALRGNARGAARLLEYRARTDAYEPPREVFACKVSYPHLLRNGAGLRQETLERALIHKVAFTLVAIDMGVRHRIRLEFPRR